MKKLWIFPVALCVIAIAMTLLNIAAVKEVEKRVAPAQHITPQSKPDSNAAPHANAPQPDARLARLPDGQVQYKPALETSRALDSIRTPKEALAIIERLLGHYRFAYKENPVGVENFEITEQLLGKNPKKIVFIAPDTTALRGNELIDQWGTPYFFHAQSGQQMDIRSAGLDKEFWTDDDVFLSQE
jgi:hypothetical protein|tara:strand:+ start:3916 stop:4473 length:558 start_codon:yes stop_codon:yes gene_type:complete